jgi:hypothetical protein
MRADIKNGDKYIFKKHSYSPENRSVWQSDSIKGNPHDSLVKIWMSTQNSVYIQYFYWSYDTTNVITECPFNIDLWFE